jgi:undecaprenyl-diphosphatase
VTRFVLAAAVLLSVWTAMLVFGAGALDHDILRILYAGGHSVFARAAWIVTQLGGAAVLMPVTAIGALLLIVRRDLRGAALLLGITLSGRILIELQKGWTARPRPEDYLHLVATRSDSFPSGHAGNATLVWLTLALLIPRTARLRAPLLWTAALLAVAVGLSRPMLGVHWASDVVAGWAFGLFWMVLLLRLSGYKFPETLKSSAK